MIEIPVQVTRSAEVPASPQEVFALLSEVPDSVAHFPDVESLVPEGEGYLWRLKKAGLGSFAVETVYACRYHSDPDALTVTWTPIEGVGNARVSGRWTIEPAGSGARFTLENEIVLSLDLPRLAVPVARALVVRENTRLIERYLRNLAATLSGNDGRLRRPG